MLVSQFVDGLQLPVILIFIALMTADRSLMGQHASGPVLQTVQRATAGILSLMSLALVVRTVFGFG